MYNLNGSLWGAGQDLSVWSSAVVKTDATRAYLLAAYITNVYPALDAARWAGFTVWVDSAWICVVVCEEYA